MGKMKKLLKDVSLKGDIINTLMGVALIISLIMIYRKPGNPYPILAACIFGGGMNILNGLKFLKDPKKKTTGMTFLMMGVVVIGLGFFIVEMF